MVERLSLSWISSSLRWQRAVMILLPVFLLLSLSLTIVIVIVGNESIFSSNVITAILSPILLLSTVYALIRSTGARGGPSESPSAKRARRLVNDFMDATNDLPASIREELVYRLAREGADLPPDLFLRFLTELTSKQLRIDRDTNLRLRSWLEEFASVEPPDRRALIVQLRRAIL